MTSEFRGRKTYREIVATNQKSMDNLAALWGMSLLKRHPRVAQVWRQNSGTFQERNRDGSVRYIRANTQKGMSDIMGILKDGRTLAIEVKSRTGRMRPGQEEFLQTIRQAGGVAGVCRSVDDAQKLLEAA
jgi:hypothetical protein